MVGLELALSVSGGARGEREQPLLRTVDDWLELRRRMLELAPDQTQDGHRLLVEALQASLLAAVGDDLRKTIGATAQELCGAVVDSWDERGEPIGVRTLESFYGLSVLIFPLPRGPQLRPSIHLWLEQLGLERGDLLQESLAGLALVARNEPRALRQAGWPARHSEQRKKIVDRAQGILTEAEDVRDQLGEYGSDYYEVESSGYQAYRWRGMLEDLKTAGGDNRRSRRVMSRLGVVESELRRWAKQKDQEAEDRAAEGDYEEVDDEDEGPDPRDFSINEVLSDL